MNSSGALERGTVSRRGGRALHRASQAAVALLVGATGAAAGAAPAIDAFAARARVEQVALSPDGSKLVLVQTQDDKGMVVVADRKAGTRTVLLGEPEGFRLAWCRWASDIRVLCGYSRAEGDQFEISTMTRMVAVDADGANVKVLLKKTDARYQDDVLAWRTPTPGTILVQAPDDTGGGLVSGGTAVGFPAVWELDIVTDRRKIVQRPRTSVVDWLADARGQVRLGWGYDDTTFSYFARLDGSDEWRRLARFDVRDRRAVLEPVAISLEEPNKAYAIGPHEGRDAVWLIDLADQEAPKLLHSEPDVDVGGVALGRDGRLIGYYVEREGPQIHYVDAKVRAVANGIGKAFPGQFVQVVDWSDDASVYLVRTSGDVDPPSYSVFERASGTLTLVGNPFPGVDPKALRPAQPIRYAARDGTSIPGYLTLPRDAAKGVPLVVMPHGGPAARDTLGYDFLRQFLVSRGYGVLQMNFRGSTGYGDAWFDAAHQDWGGLTYDDVLDGARWAVREGIAGPERVAVVGWSFGGYVALLAAQRNADLFRCAASIAGVSDLAMLVNDAAGSSVYRLVREQVGRDWDKLKRDSPRLHAAQFGAPVLLVHGTLDVQAPFEHSEKMHKALEKARKPSRLVKIDGGSHSLDTAAHRAMMLREVESFLDGCLAAPAG